MTGAPAPSPPTTPPSLRVPLSGPRPDDACVTIPPPLPPLQALCDGERQGSASPSCPLPFYQNLSRLHCLIQCPTNRPEPGPTAPKGRQSRRKRSTSPEHETRIKRTRTAHPQRLLRPHVMMDRWGATLASSVRHLPHRRYHQRVHQRLLNSVLKSGVHPRVSTLRQPSFQNKKQNTGERSKVALPPRGKLVSAFAPFTLVLNMRDVFPVARHVDKIQRRVVRTPDAGHHSVLLYAAVRWRMIASSNAANTKTPPFGVPVRYALEFRTAPQAPNCIGGSGGRMLYAPQWGVWGVRGAKPPGDFFWPEICLCQNQK